MRIRPKTGEIRGGGGPVKVGRRQVLPGGERELGAREVEELLVRSKFTPRPSQKGARILRPEIPAQGAELPAPRKFRPLGAEFPACRQRLPGKNCHKKNWTRVIESKGSGTSWGLG